MSSRVIRLPGPLPVTWLRSTPTSRANRRIAGPAAMSPLSVATGAGAGVGSGTGSGSGVGSGDELEMSLL